MSKILILVCVFSPSLSSSLFDQELYRAALDPELCQRQLQTMEKSEFYASSFRVPQELLLGNFENYGNYRQCLAINQHDVTGKYCLIRAHFSNPIIRIPSLAGASEVSNVTWTVIEWPEQGKFRDGAEVRGNKTALRANLSPAPPEQMRLAVCVPRACSAASLLQPFAEHALVRFNYSEEYCRLPGDKPYLAADYVALILLSVLGLLTVISTTYELHHLFILKLVPASKLLQVWSLYSNTSRLLSTDNRPRPLACLEGVRALSMLWIIVLHSAGCVAGFLLQTTVSKVVTPAQYVWVFMGFAAVDSFFVLSGLLLVYVTANKTKQLTVRKLPMLYLNRYVRLFPLLATAVMLQAVALRLVDGPLDPDNALNVDNCRSYWWSVLLHVQNIVNPRSLCLLHSWYVRADIQMYVVAALVLCGGWRAVAAAAAASQAASLAICLYFHFQDVPAQMYDAVLRLSVVFDYDVWYYYGTIARSPPFFLGMLCGYALHLYRDEKLVLPKWSVFLGYSLALVLSSAIFAQHPGFHAYWENQLALDLRHAFFRSFWALALCWLIFACACGYGGPVNWFLSLPLWQLVARLSYGMYLFSVVIQGMRYADGQDRNLVTESLLWNFLGDLGITVAVTVAATLAVESPLLRLYSLVLAPAPRTVAKDGASEGSISRL